MLRIAIVEDVEASAQTLVCFCARYAAENSMEIMTACFDNPIVFLQKYRGEFDVVLMDILMPQMNGMECARRLRKCDSNVILCFVTNMARYAIQGYEVGTIDFIIKPVSYDEFSMKMNRIIRVLKKQASATILISSRNEIKKIDIRDLYYVEVYNHSLIYHTSDGNFEAYGKLSSLEDDDRFRCFIRVSPSYMVNCTMITSVQEDCLTVKDVRIPISRRRRKECLEKMADSGRDLLMMWFINYFHIQILAIELLFCLRLQRRNHFLLRFLPCAAAYVALPAVVPNSFFNPFVVLDWFTFGFLAMFMLSGLLIWFCFRMNIRRVVFYCCVAHTLQHMVHCLNRMIGLAFSLPDAAVQAIHLLMLIATCVVVYRLLRNRFPGSETVDIQNSPAQNRSSLFSQFRLRFDYVCLH